MQFTVLNKITNIEKANIEVCKSISGISGVRLREAHYSLGESAVSKMLSIEDNNLEFSVLILMRAGLNFGLGIADTLEKNNYKVEIHFIYDDKVTNEVLDNLIGKQVIIVDAVINSGKSVVTILEQLPITERSQCKVFTTVIPSRSLDKIKIPNLYAIRLSNNQYKGSKVLKVRNGIGPDTGDRLFGTLEL